MKTLPKLTVIVAFCVSGFTCIGQNKNGSSLEKYSSFSMYYSFAGLGSNMGHMFPTLRIHGTNFTYTKEQNSYYGKPDLKPDSICKGTLRTSSIDSILSLVKAVKQRSTFLSNDGVRSGGIYNMSIVNGKDTVGYEMMNTFDWIPLKIVAIINQYLPMDNKIWASEELITNRINYEKYEEKMHLEMEQEKKVEAKLANEINAIREAHSDSIGAKIIGDWNGHGTQIIASSTILKSGKGNPVENGTPSEWAIIFSSKMVDTLKIGCCEPILINDGILMGKYQDALSVFQAPGNGCVYAFTTYGCDWNGSWHKIIEPFLIPNGCAELSKRELQGKVVREGEMVYYYKTDFSSEPFKEIKTKAW